jgi:hypothetical protein
MSMGVKSQNKSEKGTGSLEISVSVSVVTRTT